MEDIGKIISNGFETYTKNLVLVIPFILNAVITGILAVVMVGIGFFYLFGSSLSAIGSASTSQAAAAILLPLITRHFYEIVILVIVYFLVFLFFQSFFMAGAISMAQKATETGKSDLSAMIEAGKKNVVNLYLAEILVTLLALAASCSSSRAQQGLILISFYPEIIQMRFWCWQVGFFMGNIHSDHKPFPGGFQLCPGNREPRTRGWYNCRFWIFQSS